MMSDVLISDDIRAIMDNNSLKIELACSMGTVTQGGNTKQKKFNSKNANYLHKKYPFTPC